MYNNYSAIVELSATEKLQVFALAYNSASGTFNAYGQTQSSTHFSAYRIGI